jgi:hypothetical protein
MDRAGVMCVTRSCIVIRRIASCVVIGSRGSLSGIWVMKLNE